MRLPRRGAAALAATSVAFLSTGWLLASPAGAQTATANASPTAPIIYNAAGLPNYNKTPGYGGDGGKAGSAQLNSPTDVATDGLGNMYFSDSGNDRVRKVTSATTGIITTVAGNGLFGFGGDGGLATSAKLAVPTGVAVDTVGDIFIADTLNNRIREVTVADGGKIHTVAGNGRCPGKGGTGDGGPATSASLCLPIGVAVDGANILVADTGTSEVRKFTVGGTITMLAGYPNVLFPEGVAVDTLHNVYVGDTFHHQIKKITPGGVISVFAGTGSAGFADGPAASAQFDLPSGVTVNAGDVYVSDTGNNRIRKISAGVVSTYGGTGVLGYSGDGGPATQAKLMLPFGLSTDKDVQSAMSSMSGTEKSVLQQIYFPTGVAGASQPGEIFLADLGNNHIRAITPGAPPVIPETAYAYLLPISALLLAGGGYVIVRRRRRPRTAQASI